ncbi:MAG: NADH:ubiquinone reductase (Na(+)-transporting) subunit F [Bacteroidales bacterium]|jgi:Na+-transporting NADH:ubiquinone oxidoreductase subunit F|nr:NADH:ubiquinone reductase (Na(+)-transporting) subunit F [Bacteroidales bacterium]MBO7305789.1 NADH:ubiquinone reductase (Na(+)-transporting) subunit F [Bacteroidales bacterium]MBQ1219071.1 NADH:ubiquinone reductase (Na(+)-transporting) subunit F [Bacteroidales bacterium]MBQ1930188.1 NADH:ubiquinone reductase (Na(+)-transporting) subunit F [Bacteroidales bacterium]
MTQIIIISVIAFLVVTLILVGLLLFAKAKLTPSGTVKININNGSKVIEVAPGGSLLGTLANEKIFLPSACGGKGSCGQCKCRVISGGGTILPTEVGFFNRKQILNNWRLGCQVKVKEDLEIEVPESALSVKKWECEVISNRNVATFIKEFCVKIPDGETLNYRSGGYIQVDVPAITIDYKNIDVDEQFREDWEKMGVFNLKMVNPTPTLRAYSMATYPAEGNIIKLNVRIATPPFDRAKGGFVDVNPGICSSYIYSLKPGDKVMISGPYGEFFVPDNCPDDQEFVFIGGGAGMAPMRSHIMHLFKTEKTSRKVNFFYGARSLKEAFYLEDYAQIEKEFPNFKFHLALDRPDPEADAAGVPYVAGFVHNVLYETYLKQHEAPEDILYLMCGPPMMAQSVVNLLDSLGVASENILFDNFGG